MTMHGIHVELVGPSRRWWADTLRIEGDEGSATADFLTTRAILTAFIYVMPDIWESVVFTFVFIDTADDTGDTTYFDDISKMP